MAIVASFNSRQQIHHLRLTLGAVESGPLLLTQAADILIGQPLTEQTIAPVAELASKAATPMDNTDMTAA